MAITLAHPAAVLPLARMMGQYGVLSALIIGSVVPDTPRFVPLVDRDDTHTLAGLLLYCVPVGLVIFCLFHRFIKYPLTMLLPDRFRSNVAPYSEAHWGVTRFGAGPVLLSLLLGAATHLAWDLFTHRHTHMAFLSLPVAEIWGHTLRLHRALQYGTSLIGIIVIVAFAWHWFRSQRPAVAAPATPFSAAQRMAIVSALVLLPVLAGLAVTWPRVVSVESVAEGIRAARRVMNVSMSTFVAGVFCYGLLFTFAERRQYSSSADMTDAATVPVTLLPAEPTESD